MNLGPTFLQKVRPSVTIYRVKVVIEHLNNITKEQQNHSISFTLRLVFGKEPNAIYQKCVHVTLHTTTYPLFLNEIVRLTQIDSTAIDFG